MVKFVLKAIAGFVVVFFIQALLKSGFAQTVGQNMLDAAAWTPGSTPPTVYMISSVLATLVAATLAGGVGALIVGKARFRHALVYGTIIVSLAMWANWATLTNAPHPYEWPLILAPLVAIPLGAYVIMRMKPLATATTPVMS